MSVCLTVSHCLSPSLGSVQPGSSVSTEAEAGPVWGHSTLLYSTLLSTAGPARHLAPVTTRGGWELSSPASPSTPHLPWVPLSFPPGLSRQIQTGFLPSSTTPPSLPPFLPPSVRPPGSCGSFLIPRTVLFLFLLLLLLRSKYWSADPLSPWQSQHYTQETPHLG